MFDSIKPTKLCQNFGNNSNIPIKRKLLLLATYLFGITPLLLESVFAQTITEVSWRHTDPITATIAQATGGYGAPIRIRVTVNNLPAFGSVYLGCSYIDKSGEEIDLEAREIRLMSRRSKFDYRVPFYAESVAIILWEKKITNDVVDKLRGPEYKDVMASHNALEFYDRVARLKGIGYFMLGRINSTGWMYLGIVREPGQILGGTLYP